MNILLKRANKLTRDGWLVWPHHEFHGQEYMYYIVIVIHTLCTVCSVLSIMLLAHFYFQLEVIILTKGLSEQVSCRGGDVHV